jgi:hypothetical protein
MMARMLADYLILVKRFSVHKNLAAEHLFPPGRGAGTI